MEYVQCRYCGEAVEYDPKQANRTMLCRVCNHIVYLPKEETSAEGVKYLRAANCEIILGRFDEAFKLYQKVSETDNKEPEAYWGKLLARYKVQYVKDEVKKRYCPICFAAPQKSKLDLKNDSDYKRAVKLATDEQREEYERLAEELISIYRKFYEFKERRLSYDCFICVKVSELQTDNIQEYLKGQTTEDCNWLLKSGLYVHLQKQNYKPFFSEYDCKTNSGADYEALILYALTSAKCMILICNNEEYLRTPWVRNEYERFCKMIKCGQKRTDALTVVCTDMNMELPEVMGAVQKIQRGKDDTLLLISDFVKRHTDSKIANTDGILNKNSEAQEEAAKARDEVRKLQEELRKAQEEAEHAKREAAARAQAEKEAQARAAAAQQKAEEERKKREAENNYPSLENYDREEFEIDGTTLKKYKGKGGEVKIPNGVTSIGSDSFYGCRSLTSITIPSGVTSIGYHAFSDCRSLASITVESGNKQYHAAGNCLIETATKTLISGCANSVIPTDGSVTLIEEDAFCGRTNLTSIAIPDGVTSIDKYAFYNCSSLTSITLPNSLTWIGYGVFQRCTGLTSITVGRENKFYHSADNCLIETKTKTLIKGCANSVIPTDGSVTLIGTCAFDGCESLTSITIPNSVTSIEYHAFSGCKGLTSITIPNGVTEIGKEAFKGCIGLTSIVIPASVTSIGEGAFFTFIFDGRTFDCECGNLQSIIVAKGNKTYHSAGNCLIETEKKTIIRGCVNSEIPADESVTTIGWSAFCGCTDLTSITIPKNVTLIEDGAFDACFNLKDIIFNGTQADWALVNMGASFECDDYFVHCLDEGFKIEGTVLIEYGGDEAVIEIPDYVTSIEDYVFYGCSSLTSIKIPNGVASIGQELFRDCINLTNIEIPNSVASIGYRAFKACGSLTNIKFNGTKAEWDAIQKGEDWDADTGDYVVHCTDGDVKCEEDSTYPTLGNYDREEFEIDGTVLEIYKGEGGAVKIPNGVTSIGDEAFKRCENLTSITIPNGVISIGGEAFDGCKNLASIEIPNGVTSIGFSAFGGCSITSIKIPNSVTLIGENAFIGCSSLTSIEIPKSVTSIGKNAFFWCGSLTSIEIPKSVISIGSSAFNHCSSLTSINFNGTKAEWNAIQKGEDWDADTGDYVVHCTDGDVKCEEDSNYPTLENYNRKEFEIDGTVLKKYKGAGGDVKIPNGVTSIGNYAFSVCSSLTNIEIPKGVTSIGGSAFWCCSSLTNIEIPKGVTSIGKYAFCHCSSLTSITFNSEKMSWRAIRKGRYWDYGTGKYTVYCTNGNIVKKS